MTHRALVKLLLLLLVLFRSGGFIYAQAPAGPLLWLRADTGIEDSSGVKYWRDQSAYHHDARQLAPEHRPALIQNALGALPAVQFRGWVYFNCDSIFPVGHDYSVSAVLQLHDTSFQENVLSGFGHAFWFNQSRYPSVLHGGIQSSQAASVPIELTGSWVTVIYSARTSTVRIFVNGLFSDSLWIPSNDDPTTYVGAFRSAYCFAGSLSEVILYNRAITDSEEVAWDHYVMSRYGLPIRSSAPIPDTTFSSLPLHLQFYARDAQDSATIPIAGRLPALGFDSVVVEVSKDGTSYKRIATKLSYAEGSASFAVQ